MSLRADSTNRRLVLVSPKQEALPARGGTPLDQVRVLLVADAEIVVTGLRQLLETSRDRIELLGAVSRDQDVVAAATARRADVVVMDADRRGTVDLELVAPVLQQDSGVRVVLLSSCNDERRLFEALRAGAAGYLLKSLRATELVGLLERARDGQVVVDPSMASSLALAAGNGREAGGWPGADLGLTRRESEVLELAADGLSNQEIAQRLVVGRETVKTHLSSLYRKLKVADRASAVALALRAGIFT